MDLEGRGLAEPEDSVHEPLVHAFLQNLFRAAAALVEAVEYRIQDVVGREGVGVLLALLEFGRGGLGDGRGGRGRR